MDRDVGGIANRNMDTFSDRLW